MAQKTVFDLIKKQNGERFAKAIRNYDNGIFDVPGIVDIVKYAGRDAEPIMNYLVSLKKISVQNTGDVADPFTLLATVGYSATYADTLQKQNAIRSYFAPGEELCTFKDELRFQNYYIMNVVHKDARKLKRKDFPFPRREDAYGTSVMSIQILKSGGFISIKNRYNHSVINPDNTYGSDPDNIVDGLSAALSKFFNVDFSSQVGKLPNGYVLFGDRVLKFNVEKNNIYYGADFVAYNGVIYDIDKRHEIILDDCVWDVGQRTARTVPGITTETGLSHVLMSEWKDKKIHILKPASDVTRILCDNGDYVDVRDGMVIQLRLNNIKDAPVGFLANAVGVEKLDLPNLETASDGFLSTNKSLRELSVPQLRSVGASFLYCNLGLKKLSAPQLVSVGNMFMSCNTDMSELDLPMLEKVGDFFLLRNVGIRNLNLPRLKSVGNEFMYTNSLIKTLNLPQLTSVNDGFLKRNITLRRLDLPQLKYVGDEFLMDNPGIEAVNLPQLIRIGDEFMFHNNKLKTVRLPMLQKMGDNIFGENIVLKRLVTPQLTVVPAMMFMGGKSPLEYFFAPNISKPSRLAFGVRDAWINAMMRDGDKKVAERLIAQDKDRAYASANQRVLDSDGESAIRAKLMDNERES